MNHQLFWEVLRDEVPKKTVQAVVNMNQIKAKKSRAFLLKVNNSVPKIDHITETVINFYKIDPSSVETEIYNTSYDKFGVNPIYKGVESEKEWRDAILRNFFHSVWLKTANDIDRQKYLSLYDIHVNFYRLELIDRN